MAQPSSRSTLIDYCKRQLGAPLLEINIADEQVSDLVDDAIQFFQERHYAFPKAFVKIYKNFPFLHLTIGHLFRVDYLTL